jgi:NAD(P)-dependent dehydrogenase (short-subunit alcohol dehydrogenase family)
MDYTGKNCLITGANSGLGFAVANRFAALGADTILVCRNKDKGEKAIIKIKSDLPNASVELMICDLSSIKSIKGFIKEFKDKYSKLDILYNNAAVMKQKRMVTEDGFEMMFHVNFLAPFILMNSLLDLLKNGSTPFIINNGRPADKLRLEMDDLQFIKNYSMYDCFFKTKLCLLFSTIELSRRPESDGITVTMIDPGPFKSDLVRDVPIIGFLKNLFSAPVEKAAENILYHIASDNVEVINGKVFKEKEEKPLTEYWKDTSISREVWNYAESSIIEKIN